MRNTKTITLLGDKVSTQIFALFLKLNLNNKNIKNRIEILPLAEFSKNTSDPLPLSTFLNNTHKEHIVKQDHSCQDQLNLFNKLLKLGENEILNSNEIPKNFSNIPLLSSNSDSEISNKNLITNSSLFQIRFFEFKMYWNRSKLTKCQKFDMSTEEFLNELKVKADFKEFLKKLFNGKTFLS